MVPSGSVPLPFNETLLAAARCSSGCGSSAPSSSSGWRALAARDQVEILGGGYFEPVLASLPERDRIGQLQRMSSELEGLFGRRPRGAWLAERVWEPDLPTSLVAGGYDWTILDDAHFRSASIREEDHWGPYSTDDQGQLLRVFGTEQGLRYRIPFRDVEEVIDYLREHATDEGERIGTMGDDGEKFGSWPTTWLHCWGKDRWVDRFFEALEENAGWLTTTTPSDWLDDAPADRARLHPDRLVRGDGRVGAAGRREQSSSRTCSRTPRRSDLPGGALAARRVLAQLPGQVPRDQRPPQADAPDVGRGRRDGARAGPRPRPRPPLPGPVQRLLLARPVRRHLHQPHAARDVRAPDRGGGPRRRATPAGCDVAERRDLDLDGHDDVRLAGDRARSSPST